MTPGPNEVIRFMFVAQRGDDVLGGIRSEAVFQSVQEVLLDEGVDEEVVARVADRFEILQSRVNRRVVDA